ncbi:MAG: phenylalanine--tRNA ligase subunit beta [Actinobacteria bacterium]|nr:phenylalanine--tRNA ligase subunit beta [Actinomycetota bacterium]
MKVTINWLKEFLKIDHLNPADVAELLTMSGTEVKNIEYVGERFKNIVIGQIVECRRHPDADKLSVCQVNIGDKLLSIVCGASNFDVGDKVAVALEGARTVQGIEIKKAKLRGIVSEGMMCSEAELGISSESAGIMILDEGYVPGNYFAEAAGLDDVILELEITPNRSDCLSIIGIAREISALTKITFLTPEYDYSSELNIDNNFEIVIDDHILCPRYSAKIFSKIPRVKTPDWMKNRLIICDYRPVDIIVDLTNYIMHEVGQPLHAFDKELLHSNKIIVRTARKGEKIRTIDDNLRNLQEGMLLITDEAKPVAVAGIMGGKDTEISKNTINVLLESANFSGPSIMRTSSSLGLRSEASNRFEKKIDPELTVFAINRFEDLLSKVSGYKPEAGIYDNYKKMTRERKLDLRLSKVRNVLGEDIDARDVSEILSGLNIRNHQSETDKNIIEAVVPSFRFEDLEREIDLIEEIARIHGFEKFKSVPPQLNLKKGKYTYYQKIIKSIRQSLCGIGLYEVINYSFIGRSWIEKLKLTIEEGYKDSIRILNPINEDFALLKTSPMPLMIRNLLNNINHGIKDMGIFEITRIFRKKEGSRLPDEINTLGIMLTGKKNVKSWNGQDKNYDFYDIKGIMEYLFRPYFKNNNLIFKKKEYSFFHPVISTDIYTNIGNLKIGIMGKIHPLIIDLIELGQDVYYLEVNLDEFINNAEDSIYFEAIPMFPSIEIDIALVVDEAIKNSEIETEIKKSGSDLLKSVRLFDIYRGKQIEDGKKSMAYSLTFLDKTRTLKDVEIEIIIKRILENLSKKFKTRLRD